MRVDAARRLHAVTQVEIVVPVKNEERDVAPCVRRLVAFLRDGFPFTARVAVADNASTDGTLAVARWLAAHFEEVRATEGSQEAAPIELATGGDAVMAIGGFNGTDPAPTLAEFEAMVAKHEIHYYVGRGGDSFGGGAGCSAISSWVAAHFSAKTVGGVTVCDLTQEK